MKGPHPFWEAEQGPCRPSAGGRGVQEHRLRKRRFGAEYPSAQSGTFLVVPAAQGLWFGLIRKEFTPTNMKGR